MTTDKIIIEELSLIANIGCYDHEKEGPQPLLISFCITVDLLIPGQSDNLEATLDYTALINQIKNELSKKHYHLLEHAAESICKRLFKDFNKIKEIDLMISKPNIYKEAKRVGVSITRNRIHYPL